MGYRGKHRHRGIVRYLEAGLSIQELIGWIESLADDSETHSKNILKFNDAIKDLIAYSESAVEPLIASLLRAKTRWTMWGVCWALHDIGDARAVEPLLTSYASNSGNIDNQIHALHALSGLKDERLFEFFISLLSHKNADLRLQGIAGLGHLGDPRAIELLFPMLEADPKEAFVKQVLIDALVDLRDERVLDVIIAQIPKAKLNDLYSIIHTLGKMGGLKAVKALQTIINKLNTYSKDASQYDRLRLYAVNAVAQIDDPASKPVLEAALLHAKRGVRKHARRALNKLNA